MRMTQIILAFAVALAVTFALGAAAMALFDQMSWANAAANGGLAAPALDLSARWAWILGTAEGLLRNLLYPLILATGLIIAFVAAALINRLIPALRFWWYAGAGAVALAVILWALQLSLGIMPIPGARSMAGMAAQCAAGLAGGAVYALLSRSRRAL